MRLECDPDVRYRTQLRTHILLESCGLLDDAWIRDREDNNAIAEARRRWVAAVNAVEMRGMVSPDHSTQDDEGDEDPPAGWPGPDAWHPSTPVETQVAAASTGSQRSADADLGQGSSPRARETSPVKAAPQGPLEPFHDPAMLRLAMASAERDPAFAQMPDDVQARLLRMFAAGNAPHASRRERRDAWAALYSFYNLRAATDRTQGPRAPRAYPTRSWPRGASGSAEGPLAPQAYPAGRWPRGASWSAEGSLAPQAYPTGASGSAGAAGSTQSGGTSGAPGSAGAAGSSQGGGDPGSRTNS